MHEDLLETAVTAARAGADVLRRYFRHAGLEVSRKGQNDFVTQADKESEDAVLAVIHERYPDHRILAEAGGAARARRGGGGPPRAPNGCAPRGEGEGERAALAVIHERSPDHRILAEGGSAAG